MLFTLCRCTLIDLTKRDRIRPDIHVTLDDIFVIKRRRPLKRKT